MKISLRNFLSVGIILGFLFSFIAPPYAQAQLSNQLRDESKLSGDLQDSKAVKKFLQEVRALLPLERFHALQKEYFTHLKEIKKDSSQNSASHFMNEWKKNIFGVKSNSFNKGLLRFASLLLLSVPLTACFLFPSQPAAQILPPFAPKLVVTDPVTDEDRAYLDDVAQKGLQYFLDKVDKDSGYIVDQTYRVGIRTSTSNLGILLTNLAIGHELKKKSSFGVETRETVLKILKNIQEMTQPYQTVTISQPKYIPDQKFGFIPTWSDVHNAEPEKKEALDDIKLGNGQPLLKRGEIYSEFSALDAGNLAAGLIEVRQAFKEDIELSDLASKLLDGMNWKLLERPDGLMTGGGYFIYKEDGSLYRFRLNSDWQLEGHSDSSLAYWVAVGSGKFDPQSFWKKNYIDDSKTNRRGDKEFKFTYNGIEFPYIGYKDNLSEDPKDRGDGGLFMRGIPLAYVLGTDYDNLLLQEGASQIAYATSKGYKAFGISASAGLDGGYHGWGGMDPGEVASYASAFFFNLPGFEKSAIENLKKFKGDKYGPYDTMSASNISKVLEGHTTWDLGLQTVNIVNYRYDGLVRNLFNQDPMSQKVRELYPDYSLTSEKSKAFEERSKETLQKLESLPQIRKSYRISSFLPSITRFPMSGKDSEDGIVWMGLFLFNPSFAFSKFTQWLTHWFETMKLTPLQRETKLLRLKMEEIFTHYYSLTEALKDSQEKDATQLVVNMMDLLVAANTWVPFIRENEEMGLVLVIDERVIDKIEVIKKLKSFGLEKNRFQIVSQSMEGKKFDLKILLQSNQFARKDHLVVLKTKLNGLEFWKNSEGFRSILFEVESEKLNNWFQQFINSNANQIGSLKDSFGQILNQSLTSIEQDFHTICIVGQQQ